MIKGLPHCGHGNQVKGFGNQHNKKKMFKTVNKEIINTIKKKVVQNSK